MKNRDIQMRLLLAFLGQCLLKYPQLLLYMEKKKSAGYSLRCLTLILNFGYLKLLQFVLVPVLRGLSGFLAILVILVFGLVFVSC